jgi:radical SAM protein with 4Fe4S-binding SPASM domain
MEEKDKIYLFPGMAGMTREIVDRMKREGVQLLSVDIMVTQRCNFKCIYCYAEGAPEKKNELLMSEAKQLADDCVDLGVRIVNIQGGEPLYWHPADWTGPRGEAFFHLIEYVKAAYAAKKLPVNVLSFTDVAMITKEKAERLRQLEVSLCCKRDTLNDETQDLLLGVKGGAKSIQRGFQYLSDAGYGKPGAPPLSTNTVVTVVNYDDIPDLFRWSRRQGFRPFVIPVHVHGRAKNYAAQMLSGKTNGSTLNSEAIRKLFEKLAEIDGKEFDIHWKAESPWVENKACSRHLGGVHVRADGMVLPCSEAPDEWSLGHIRKSPFKEIVASDKVKKFRDIYSQLHDSQCSPSRCSLAAEQKCYGCRTRAYDDSAFDQNGNYDPNRLNPDAFFDGDPACWRSK